MKARSWLATGAAGAAGLLGYAVAVEPYAIQIVRRELYSPRLPRGLDGYTICQISDLHMTQMGRRERALQRLLHGLPIFDLVAVTGDMIHTHAGVQPFLELAKSFRSRDGAFAVYGNSEHKNGVRPYSFARALADGGLTPLMNCHEVITRGADALVVAGVDDPVNNRDNIKGALHGTPAGAFTLLLMHSPDSIAEAVVRGVDIVLSGHTHGGQVRLPLIGPLHTHSLLGLRMDSGLYAGGRLQRVIGIRPGLTQMYVTRGLGVSGLALRFLAPPELTILTLRRGALERSEMGKRK